MIVAVALTVVGMLLAIAVVHLTDFRLSGVLLAPVLAVYGLYEIYTVPVLLGSFTLAFVVLGLLERWTRLFGCQLLVASILAGLAVPFLLGAVVSGVWIYYIPVTEVAAVGCLLAGVAAFEYRQLDPDRRRWDAFASLASLAVLLGLGAWLVASKLAVGVASLFPLLLLSAESDIAVLGGTVIGTSDPQFLSPYLVVPLILGGVILSEWGCKRWGIRLLGTVVVPLLALITLTHAIYLYSFVLLLSVVFVAIDYTHRRTLLYGRVLLSLSVVFALLAMLPVAYFYYRLSGFHFFLVAGFAGVGAYNLHRMPGVDRVHTLSLSGGFFVAFLYGISTALYPASGGIGAPFTRIELAVATVVIAIATWSAILLEYRRQTGLAGGALLTRILGGVDR
jgi:MFS family permease